MRITETIEVPHRPEVVYSVVRDLAGYPGWIDIVNRVIPDDDPDGAAWTVDLRGRVGPLARSKRLRMVRTEADEPRHVAFERRELDTRAHSPWVLSASIDETTGTSDTTRLTMQLSYGGRLWGPVLERLLGEVIQSSRPRLIALLDAADH